LGDSIAVTRSWSAVFSVRALPLGMAMLRIIGVIGDSLVSSCHNSYLAFSDSLCSGSSTLQFVCHVNFTVKGGLGTRNAPKN